MPDDYPHRLNVPGPFYIADQCCTACMAPHGVAPSMMGFDENDRHCYVARQPATDRENYQMIRAAWSSEFECMRYAGADPDILRRLAELGMDQVCDQSPPPGAKPILRNHVSFEAKHWKLGKDVAAAFRSDLKARTTYWVSEVSRPRSRDNETTLDFSWVRSVLPNWSRHDDHTVWFRSLANGRFLIRHSPFRKVGDLAVSLRLDDWLRDDGRVTNIRWYTSDAWNRGAHDDYQATPI